MFQINIPLIIQFSQKYERKSFSIDKTVLDINVHISVYLANKDSPLTGI